MGLIIFLSLTIHFFFSIFCVFSTLDLERKWYENIYLWIPFFNVPYCLFNLQFKNNCLSVENLCAENKIRVLIRSLTLPTYVNGTTEVEKPKENGNLLKPFKFLDNENENN